MSKLNDTLTVQTTSLKKAEGIHAAVAQEIEKLDRKNLRAEALVNMERDIRTRAFEALKDAHNGVPGRSAWARNEARFYTPEAARRRAKFNVADESKEALLRSDFRATMATTPSAELIEHLKDAVATPGERALAQAEVIRLEFQNRKDGEGVQEAFKQAFAAIPTPSFEEEREKLREIVRAGALIDVLITSLRARTEKG